MYDEYIVYMDAEFGRLYDSLKQMNILDNTILVFTSDHGEMFERGIVRHFTETLYQPITHIPLFIIIPNQSERVDVIQPTSAIDVLPTLLELTGKSIPNWIEGQILPGFTTKQLNYNRNIFTIDGRSNPKNKSLNIGSIALVKGEYKLIYYFGFSDYDQVFELYNIEEDPEELCDLYHQKHPMAKVLKDELLTKLDEANQPFRS
jgi:arylsulfatase A-like enzyme